MDGIDYWVMAMWFNRGFRVCLVYRSDCRPCRIIPEVKIAAAALQPDDPNGKWRASRDPCREMPVSFRPVIRMKKGSFKLVKPPAAAALARSTGSRQAGPNRDETYGGSPPETGPPASYRCFGMEGTARREHAERVTPVPRNGQLSRISTRDVRYSTAPQAA